EKAARERELTQLRDKLSVYQADEIFGRVKTVDGVKVLAAQAPFGDREQLRSFGDKVRDKLGSGVILLGGVEGDKGNLLCLVTKDLTGRFKAGDLLKNTHAEFGARGGGKPDKAEGGIPTEKLEAALQKFLSR